MNENINEKNADKATEYKLIDIIAEQVHISWMRQRTSMGWKYGDVYSKEKKLHPDLVPYSELPESEREIDRATVRQVFEALKALNYSIIKK